MSRIRAKGTKPELLVRHFLFLQGFRYRINVSSLPGKPDLVLRKYRTCIFVNGCFWHGHEGCRYFVMPKTNTLFWAQKIQRNRERDSREQQQLQQMGWNVIRIWECQLKPKQRQQTLQSLLFTLNHIVLINYGMPPEPEQLSAMRAAEEATGYTTVPRKPIDKK